uniref:Uncharacterized protein n=1 Tax=Vitis vinifera TaxID=29760 RepID=A5BAC0_VITVI|nr:hypothetical protein VITISV_025932 [Vitis vinifera]
MVSCLRRRLARQTQHGYDSCTCCRRVGPLPPRTCGTHLTVTHGTHCHPSHPHPDLPIKHTWHAFPDYLKEDQATLINISSGRITQYIRMINICPDYLKEDQTTLINISSGRLTQYIRMINICHPDTMVRIID